MEVNEYGNKMLYASFNQIMTRICVGTKVGFFVYQIDPFKCLYKSENMPGGCAIVEVLENTPIVCIVGSGAHPTSSRRRVHLLHMEQTHNELCRLAFETPVMALKMNPKRLVVALEAEIHLFNMTDHFSFMSKIDIRPNPRGLCALSGTSFLSDQMPMLLAYPGNLSGTQNGDLILYDPSSLECRRKIPKVHKHPLACVEFSLDGRWVATASDSGTVIKVVPTSERETEVYSFRRGSVYGAAISSIAFNRDVTFLAVSSPNGTVHIFDVNDGLEGKTQVKSNTYMGMLSSTLFGSEHETRSFTTIKLPVGKQSIVAFSEDSTRVYTITQDGKFSQWQLDKSRPMPGWTTSASTCKLTKEDNLLRDYCASDDEGLDEGRDQS